MTNKKFTRKEIEARNHSKDAIIIIDNLVYDVTPFLEEHPGGREILIDNAGKDATECFHDVGHSEDAREWRKKFLIGEVVEADQWEYRKREPIGSGTNDPLTLSGLVSVCAPPFLISVVICFVYMYLL